MAKVEVTYKQVGRNLNVKIGDEVLTKVGTKEELAPIKEALVLHKEKPTVKNLKALKDLLKPKTVAKEKEREIAKANIKREKRVAKKNVTVKQTVKKEESIIDQLSSKIKKGEISEKEIEELKKLVSSQAEQKKSEPVARVGRQSGGEW